MEVGQGPNWGCSEKVKKKKKKGDPKIISNRISEKLVANIPTRSSFDGLSDGSL
jgi:hypothetical protein